jgi:Zn-dependent protease
MNIDERKTDGSEILLSIPERKWLMYFVHLALAISAGVVLAKAVRAYSA